MAVKTLVIDGRDAAALRAAAEEAAEALRAGGVALFPTETVYGVGAAASRPDALAKMRRLKERSDGKPFQLLAADIGMARKFGAVFDARAEALAKAFWPGPMTLVVPEASALKAPPESSATLGIRVPASELMLAVCRALGEPVVSSSANPAGKPPPATAAEADCFGDGADLLIDVRGNGAEKTGGVPSTVVRCIGGVCEILREGGVAAEDVFAVWNGSSNQRDQCE